MEHFYFRNGVLSIRHCLKEQQIATVPSEELRIVLKIFVILLRVNSNFRNRLRIQKGPIKRTGKVCEDSQDLKSWGSLKLERNTQWLPFYTINRPLKCSESHKKINKSTR